MKEISELQTKRAVNIIWNGAGNHDFTPDFKAFDADGAADLYWNCIIGAVRRHYEYPKLEEVLREFGDYEDADVYQGLLWLGLENCVFQKERHSRPVLCRLREDYARAFVREIPGDDGCHLFDALASAHYQRALGREPRISKYDIKLLDELEFSPELTTDEIVKKARELFQRWFFLQKQEKKKNKLWIPGLRRRKASKQESRFRKFGIGYADHPADAYGSALTGDRLDAQLNTKMTAKELRAFMETKFGKSVFTETETGRIERSLCTKSHANCHLLFSNGERVALSEIQNGFEALERQREKEQVERNRKSYQENIARNRVSITRLTDKIRNSVLMYMQPTQVKSNSGRLRGGLVWRAAYLDDERIFEKSEQDDMGDLCVDILLDASTSQKYRQEIVSAQGYMIAESLTRCGIPCRVMSFCSMTGYTVVRVFRDYDKPADNKRIFEYVSNGCNRDGLAIAAAHYLMNKTSASHKMLIVLSDVKPNDVIKIRTREGAEPELYEGAAGITNTAYEVRRARADGIAVICVFTGNDEDVPSAKLVYGRDFARIQSLDKLADTVGRLIQNRIKNL